MSELYDDPTDEPDRLSAQGGDQTVVVVTNLPDQASAQKIARELIEARLAACANLMSPCESVFHWDGKIAQEREVPVWFKTTRAGTDLLVAELQRRHPYDVAEVLVLAPEMVAPEYAAWVADTIKSR